MKPKLLILIFSLLLVFAPVICAQDPLDQTVARLQSEIARREAIDRNDDTPALQKATNRANLEKARTELLNAVQAKITALQKYLDTLGDSITSEERDDARASLRKLSSAAHSSGNSSYLNRNSDPNRSAYYREAAASAANAVPSSVGNTEPEGTASEANSSSTTSTAPFEIISPLDQYSTELQEIEVFVQLVSPAAISVPLRWAVKSNGKEFANGVVTIKEGRSAEKLRVPITMGENEIAISDSTNSRLSKTVTVTRGDGSQAAAAPAAAPAGPDLSKTPFTRAIFGLEQAAAASADPTQKLFLEFNLTAPIFKKDTKPIRSPLWLWLNPRITSLPQQISGSVAEFATASNFISPFTSGKVNEIVQGFEFLGGIEVPIKLNKNTVSGEFDSGFDKDVKTRIGLSLVVGAGMSTPFSSQKTLQTFKVNQTVIDRFPVAKGKDFIAFVSGDRNRFFRQYYGGLRLKSYFVKKGTEDLANIFPGIIDVTFGQNESVTGGELHGGVVRIDGIYPFPFAGGGSIYVFGSALMKLRHPTITSPIILQPADATVQVPGANVLIQQLPTRDTDHYRLGVGVDLVRLLKNFGTKK